MIKLRYLLTVALLVALFALPGTAGAQIGEMQDTREFTATIVCQDASGEARKITVENATRAFQEADYFVIERLSGEDNIQLAYRVRPGEVCALENHPSTSAARLLIPFGIITIPALLDDPDPVSP